MGYMVASRLLKPFYAYDSRVCKEIGKMDK